MARLPGFNSPGWRAWRCGKEGEGDKGVEARKESRSTYFIEVHRASMEMISRIAQVCATFGRATIKGGLRFRERGDAFCTSIEVYAG